jgi:Ca2+-binding RTX toxin-like protein
MARDPLVPINTPFKYNVGINYESWENGRTGYSITADLNQITKYFGLIKTYHDVAVGTSNPNNPTIDPTQQTVISYVTKTANVELVMGTLNNALWQGGFGQAWAPGLMTSSTYTDKWVVMIRDAFGGIQQTQAHLKMILLGNEIDQNGPPPSDPSFGAYQGWIKQSFDNLAASLKKYGLGSIPVSTTIANYGSGNAVAVNISDYIQSHWSTAWDGGRPIVLYNQYTPATSQGPMSSTDYKPVISYFESVYKQLGGKIEPFIGETGYSTIYSQANQVKVYDQITAWLTGQHNVGGRTVPLFAFDAFDQPSRQPAVETKFGIFAENGSHQPTGLKPGLTLPSWFKTPISNSGPDSMALFSGAFSPGMTVDGGDGTDSLVLAEPQTVDLTTGALVGVEGLEGSSGDDTVTMTFDQFISFQSIDLGDGADVLRIIAQGTARLPAGPPDLIGVEVLQLIGSDGNDILEGGADDDTLIGAAGNDRLSGGAGDDRLLGGQGNDVLDGGTGGDTASYRDKTAGVSVTLAGASNATVKVNGIAEDVLRNVEHVAGGSGADVLTGDGLANRLLGGAGNDRLSGGAGDDRLLGGLGDDVLDGGTGVDTVSYKGNTAAVSVTLSGASNATVKVNGVAEDTIRNVEHVAGGSGADVLTGDGLANRLFGGAGNDRLSGGAGDDRLLGGLGDDVLDGGTGGDTTSYKDKTAAVSVTLAGASDATVKVNGVAEDIIRNVEHVAGGSGADVLAGDGLANRLFGAAGNDRLSGGAGNDRLLGGLGDDVLIGDIGNDVLTGDPGKDQFLFNATPNAITNLDRITDFNVADDTIVLENAIFTAFTTTGAISSGAFHIGATANDTNDRLIYDKATGGLFYDSNGSASGGSVQIADLSAGLSLTYEDFLIV